MEKTANIKFYGLQKGSKYNNLFDIDNLKDDEIVVSDSFLKKYGLKIDDVIECSKAYSDKKVKMKIKGVINEIKSISAFGTIENINKILENEKGYINTIRLFLCGV